MYAEHGVSCTLKFNSIFRKNERMVSHVKVSHSEFFIIPNYIAKLNSNTNSTTTSTWVENSINFV